jgi:hypothetical protein
MSEIGDQIEKHRKHNKIDDENRTPPPIRNHDHQQVQDQLSLVKIGSIALRAESSGYKQPLFNQTSAQKKSAK